MIQDESCPTGTTTKSRLSFCSLIAAALAMQMSVHLPAYAQDMPPISSTLKGMLGALPLAEAKDELTKMVGALNQTPCGGGLKGCYMTKSGPLQLYFFTSGQAQQTFLLVVDKTFPMPHLLTDKVQKVMGNTALKSPIISISTTDFALDTVRMPPDLQRVVRESYFNVNSLAFSSGVQLAARADLAGAIKTAMETFGVKGNQVTLRAAVVMPIPTDLAGAAGTGAGAAGDAAHGATMKEAGSDAMKPEAFVEFQFAPNARLPMGMPTMELTDATFFLNNSLTFGYKGNAAYRGASDKKVLVHFQTPLNPAGALDLLDFQFMMATPANFTMEDAANVMVAMASPDPRLARYGGGFIRDIESFRKPLLTVTRPLSVFQFRNPKPAPEYRFGDSKKPFPTDPRQFNMVVLGPLADNGPMMRIAGEAVILGQRMGSIDATAGVSGLHGKAMQNLSLKLGPLGRVTIQKMVAEVDVDKGRQDIRLKGNFGGQVVEVTLSGSTLRIDVPANCVNPFEIRASVEIEPTLDLAKVFDGQAGANVDPTKIGGCIGKELEAALNKIAGEYRNLSGYAASAANAELKKISEAADAAAAELKQQAEAAEKAYNDAKNAARNLANSSTNAANRALKDAENVFKGFGKKKKHKKSAPDPRFAASVFDWDYYYDNNQDLVNASVTVRVGGKKVTVKADVDLSTHWRDTGAAEGRRVSLEFDARYYRSRYLDVQARCSSEDHLCVIRHWIDYGLEQGRQGSADFSVLSYLNRYSDLQRAFGAENYVEALNHWFSNGEDERRNSRPASSFAGPVSGPQRIGGGGGGPWSDSAYCSGQYVTGFRVRSGSRVDNVQFRYGSTWAPAQGGGGGSASEVLLAPGDYIVRVEYRSGAEVDSLTFKTQSGRTYGPYGGGGGSSGSFDVTPGEKLGCMAGRSGHRTDSLTFVSSGPR